MGTPTERQTRSSPRVKSISPDNCSSSHWVLVCPGHSHGSVRQSEGDEDRRVCRHARFRSKENAVRISFSNGAISAGPRRCLQEDVITSRTASARISENDGHYGRSRLSEPLDLVAHKSEQPSRLLSAVAAVPHAVPMKMDSRNTSEIS